MTKFFADFMASERREFDPIRNCEVCKGFMARGRCADPDCPGHLTYGYTTRRFQERYPRWSLCERIAPAADVEQVEGET